MNGTVDAVLANASYYNDFFSKSAVVIRSIAGSHLFENGNKRTAQAVYELLVGRNGVRSGVDAEAVRRIIKKVSVHELEDIEDIARALQYGEF